MEAKAYCIACAIYTHDCTPCDPEHEDRLYRTVDNMTEFTDEQKAGFYAQLAESLTKDTTINQATKIIADKLRNTLHV